MEETNAFESSSADVDYVPCFIPLTFRGKGSFGHVIEAYDKKNKRRVAIKRVHKVEKRVSREQYILSKLSNCPNVLTLYDYFFSEDLEGNIIQNLVMEYVEKTLEDFLRDFIAAKAWLSLSKIRRITRQILTALDYMERQGIVHRDLKPKNILITEEGLVKICDFGAAKEIKKENFSTPYIASRYYRAPELLLGSVSYTNKIDVFAVGCIFGQLFTLEPLFKGSTEGNQLLEYIAVLGYPGDSYFTLYPALNQVMREKFKELFSHANPHNLINILNSSKAYQDEVKILFKLKDLELASDLLIKLIAINEQERLSASEALRHPFLHDEIDKD